MELLFTSLIAGMLTILAPCILPIIPIIIGTSLKEAQDKSFKKPLVIISSLAVSIVVFTLLLRASTILLDIPDYYWRNISGAIVILFGITMVWPNLWEQIMLRLGIANASNRLLARASSKKGLAGDILIGAALGPVFTSCSPTYALILATVLPVSLSSGILYLVAYALGLAIMLLIAAWLGSKLITKFGWAIDPKSKFRKVIGLLFIVVGLSFITGWDRQLQTWLIDRGIYDPISEIERSLPK